MLRETNNNLFNFSPGPAVLPDSVRQKIHDEWLDWQGTGFSVAEISHRSTRFEEMLFNTKRNIRELLAIPDNYHILFLQGGSQTQFAMAPMNLLGKNKQADYLVYGLWSEVARREAERYGEINALTVKQEIDGQLCLTPASQWELNSDAAYLHYCSNETVDGMRLPVVPDCSVPVVVDMCSDLFSQPIDVSKFGVIYASAQKNFGISGITLVIVRDDLLEQANPLTPSVFHYQQQAQKSSLLNTANTFGCYVVGLVMDWLKGQGGLAAVAKANQRKAEKLYACIDSLPETFINKVKPEFRSIMNVTFFLRNEGRQEAFLQQAARRGLLYLKGHKLRGGLRASIYNAMPEKGIDELVDFLREFA